MGLFHRLLCDAWLSQPDVPVTELADRLHQAHRYADPVVFGSPLVDDRRLGELERSGSAAPVAVTALNSSGAGGLVSLARRSFHRLRVVAVETAVRDRDDPAGNVNRIAAATRELGSDTEVYVALPDDPSWQAASEESEANGLSGLIAGDGLGSAGVVERMSGCVELDLPFRIAASAFTGIGAASDCETLLRLLLALDQLIEGTDRSKATHTLAGAADNGTDTIRDWDENRVRRIRRRLVGVDLWDPYTVAAELKERLNKVRRDVVP